MSLRSVVGLLGGLFCVAMTTPSWAQCSKDTDCKGERVCEQGACVAPPAGAAATASGAPAAPAATPAPAGAPSISASSAPTAETPRSTEVVDKRRKRHSTGMMAGGIVMVSFVPIALLAAWVADIQQNVCQADYRYDGTSTYTSRGDCDRFNPTIYGGLISAAVLAGVGIPLIIIGGKKEPVGTAQLTPWATPQAGGLSLKLQM